MGLGIQLAGIGLSAASSILGGSSVSDAANADAALSEENAKLAKYYARLESNRIDKQGRLAKGSARALYGASGLIGGFDVLADMQNDIEFDKYLAVFKGDMTARGLNMDAANSRMRGRNARNAGYYEAATYGLQAAELLLS